MSLNEEAASALHQRILAAHEALLLRGADTASPSQAQTAWMDALRALAQGNAGAALLRGMACRLLLDAKHLDSAAALAQFQRNLSLGAPPTEVAAWLDGFLNRQALILLHDDALWGAVDAWLAQLAEAPFRAILPLVRRSFADFSRSERQSLGEKAQKSVHTGLSSHANAHSAHSAKAAAFARLPWDETAAAQALPVLSQMLGWAEPMDQSSYESN